MSKSEIMISPWLTTVNRLPAHQGFPFLAVCVPACGGTFPPCGAVCVPFWNAIYTARNQYPNRHKEKMEDKYGIIT